MENYRDKCLLFLGAVGIIVWRGTGAEEVFALFLALALAAFYEFNRSRAMLLAGYGAFCLCMPWMPSFGIFFPLLAYDVFTRELWPLLGAGVLLWIPGLLDGGIGYASLMAGCLAASLVLARSTDQYLGLKEEARRQRDASRELELLLKSKNKDLMEKQDYEIHLATLNERNRIAREIHDNVGHMLSRSILQLGAIRAVSKEPAVKEQLILLSGTLNEAMDSIRKSVHDLHDESVDLETALEKILENYKEYGIKFDYQLTDKMPKPLKYCFLTVIKEALSNVVKHSNADKIQIILREFGGSYQLYFQDNGSTYQEHEYHGIGLENMRDRVEAFHGTMRIRTEKGFQIYISVPKELTEY